MPTAKLPYRKIPIKCKVYGDVSFHLKPLSPLNANIFFFVLRPSNTKDYAYQIEGVLSMGDDNYKKSREEITSGLYEEVKYHYYQDDIAKMDKEQHDAILEWAVDGGI